MARINLGADDERTIVAALEGYARHLTIKLDKAKRAPDGWTPEQLEALTKDRGRATRLARVMKDWRRSLGEAAPDVESDVESDDPNNDIVAPLLDDGLDDLTAAP